MPKRILDDSLLSSPSLARCSPRAQDAFPRFILLMDDFGCADANPKTLNGRGWALRDDVTERDVAGWLEEYVAAGMAVLWTVNERRYVHLTGWFGPHGQRKRSEYDPNAPEGTPGRHGSKRKTPAPPADLVDAVVAGFRRDHDGKPPGVDREDEIPARETTVPAANPPGNSRETKSNEITPAREIEFPAEVPPVPAISAPAVAVAVAVPDAAAAASAPVKTGGAAAARKTVMGPKSVLFVRACAVGLGHPIAPLTDSAEAAELEDRVLTLGGAEAARDVMASILRRKATDPQSARLLLDMLREVMPEEASA